jgi:hypothetical protein
MPRRCGRSAVREQKCAIQRGELPCLHSLGTDRPDERLAAVIHDRSTDHTQSITQDELQLA